MNRARDEHGFTLVELLVVCLVMGIILTGVVNILISGTRATDDANSRLEGQQNTRLALDRIEYEGRCASSATQLSSGAGVHFVLPSQCAHGSGDISWCVASGTLTRYTASSCTGSGQPFVDGITSAAPFAILAVSGDLPQLTIDLTVNSTGRSSDATSIHDAVTLRNAPVSS